MFSCFCSRAVSVLWLGDGNDTSGLNPPSRDWGTSRGGSFWEGSEQKCHMQQDSHCLGAISVISFLKKKRHQFGEYIHVPRQNSSSKSPIPERI